MIGSETVPTPIAMSLPPLELTEGFELGYEGGK